jgi:hypothetical protein
MHGRAYVHKRDTWSSAVDALKADLADTLQARLEMMLELEEEDCGAGRRPLSLSHSLTLEECHFSAALLC